MPVRFLDENNLQVAVADPTNLNTTDELRLALGVNCTLAVAAADALASTISRNYRMTVAVSDKAPESTKWTTRRWRTARSTSSTI